MRLFVAADLTDEQRAALRSKVEAARQAALFDFIRWIPEENWHATLAFIGDREESDLDSLVALIEACLLAANPLQVQPHRIQAFPSRQQPRLLALKAEPSSSLSQLYFQLNQTLGLKEAARQFRFHVTVARFRDQDEETIRNLNESIRDLTEIGGTWHIPRLTLYESSLKQSGATYRAVKSWSMRLE